MFCRQESKRPAKHQLEVPGLVYASRVRARRVVLYAEDEFGEHYDQEHAGLGLVSVRVCLPRVHPALLCCTLRMTADAGKKELPGSERSDLHLPICRSAPVPRSRFEDADLALTREGTDSGSGKEWKRIRLSETRAKPTTIIR